MNVVSVIPAYNEERYIGSLVIKARTYVDTVVVVDDGSTDCTAYIAEAAGAIVVRHKHNCGKGTALNTGFAKARELGAVAVVLLDGDGQHCPEDIPDVLRPVIEGGADMVIGSRHIEKKSEIPHYRQFGQHVVTALTNSLSGTSCTDSWSGFRSFSRRALEYIHFREDGWGVDPEFQFQAQEHELRIAEVPIVALYEERAKRNPFIHGIKTVNAILRLAGQHRPLLFFTLVGLFFLLLGTISGLWVFNAFRTTRMLAVGTALITVMLIIVGVLSCFTGIILHSVRGLVRELSLSMRRYSDDQPRSNGPTP